MNALKDKTGTPWQGCRRLMAAFCAALVLALGAPASSVAQDTNTLETTTKIPLPMPKPDEQARAQASEDAIDNLLDREPEPLFSDTLVPYAPTVRTTPGGDVEVQQGALYLMAKLTRDTPPLQSGLIWRIYSETTNEDGQLELVATAKGGDAEFRLDPGAYLIHTAYGHATATNRIVIGRDVQSKMVILNGGGVILNAALDENTPIHNGLIAFDIYGSEFNERGERNLIVRDVKPGHIVRLNADTYHIVSRYGDVNSIIRADVQVLAGKLTEATVYHKAADITLKLVNAPGGEAIANTSWSILNTGGDVVVEANGAFPDFVLAAGDYEVIARNNGVVYRSDFNVATGENREVEVVANEDQATLSN